MIRFFSKQLAGGVRPISLAALATAAGLAALVAGCPGASTADLQRQIDVKTEELAKKENELAARGTTIEELRTRLLRAQNFDPERLKRVYYPVELRIATLSGGSDYDGKPGDDGVTVYLQPIDRDGDVAKAAGEIRVQLYDLANPSGKQLIGEYHVPVDKAAELWYGKMLTSHYTVKCPWKSGPPAHDEITIRATFVDYLTTNVMTAQGTCKVALTARP